MKQHITLDQFNELNDKQKEKLMNWQFENGYYDKDGETTTVVDTKTKLEHEVYFHHFNNLLNISQMIQFLYQRVAVKIESEERESPSQGWFVNGKYPALELADALWYAVKDELK